METAGQAVAREVLRALGEGRGPRVALLCGRGLNGGDGFVAARFLRCEGVEPRVFLFGPDPRPPLVEVLAGLPGDARRNAELHVALGAEVTVSADADALLDELRRMTPGLVLVDALLGVGLRGDVRAPLAELIEGLDALASFRIAVDLPSGLDADDGSIHGNAVRADRTVTFAAPKRGLLRGAGPALAGEVVVAPLGLPLDDLPLPPPEEEEA